MALALAEVLDAWRRGSATKAHTGSLHALAMAFEPMSPLYDTPDSAQGEHTALPGELTPEHRSVMCAGSSHGRVCPVKGAVRLGSPRPMPTCVQTWMLTHGAASHMQRPPSYRQPSTPWPAPHPARLPWTRPLWS